MEPLPTLAESGESRRRIRSAESVEEAGRLQLMCETRKRGSESIYSSRGQKGRRSRRLRLGGKR